MRNETSRPNVTDGLRRSARCLIALFSGLTLSFPVCATVLAPGFAGRLPEAGLIASGSPGISFTADGGTASLDQMGGQGSKLISASTISPRSSGGQIENGFMLGAPYFSTTIGSVFLNEQFRIVDGGIFKPSLPRMTDASDRARGAITSATDPALAIAMTVRPFLLETVADIGAHYGSFTQFRSAIGADAGSTLFSEPGTATLLACGLLVLCTVETVTPRRRHRVLRGWRAGRRLRADPGPLVSESR